MSICQRLFITPPAILDGQQARPFAAGKAAWIWLPDTPAGEPSAALFVNRFRMDGSARVTVHVSADQRFRLELDGTTVARGPHRGDLAHWAFSTYELDLAAGEHTLAAEVVWAGEHAALAQHTWRPGFLFAAEGPLADVLDTGRGGWRGRALPAYAYETGPNRFASFTGDPLVYDARRAPGPEQDPVVVRDPQPEGFYHGESLPGWQLWPSNLPDLFDAPVADGKARALVDGPLADDAPVTEAMLAHEGLAAWQAMLARPDGSAPVTVPAGRTVTAIVDLEDYCTAYAGVTLSGPAGTTARLAWSEAFIHPAGSPRAGFKGRRDELRGKVYNGIQHDTFVHAPDAGRSGPRRYASTAWRAGRYVVLTVTAPADGDAAVHALSCRETRYPTDWADDFAAPEATLTEPAGLMRRGLQNCMHETYVDCPHYEQLQYVGDTRLTLLLTYTLTADDRLARRALELFEWSRGPDGLAAERYPSRTPQASTTYGLLWPCCVRDFLYYRDDPDWVRQRRPMVRASLEGALALLAEDGLFRTLPGWSFVDWVPGWPNGRAPDGDRGSLVNLHLLMALRAAAQIEDATGDPGMAARWRGFADHLGSRLVEVFWDDKRGLLADDRARTAFSEHAQCLALLEDMLPPEYAERAFAGLLAESDLAKATVYFTHYLFDAFARRGRGELVLDRMGFWRDMARDGFKTPMECPEPSRSDCHAWASHPLYHYHATLAGVRPTAPGFRKVRVAPAPGGLPWLRSTTPHPRGNVAVDLTFAEEGVKGRVTLPEGVEGEFVFGGRARALQSGENTL